MNYIRVVMQKGSISIKKEKHITKENNIKRYLSPKTYAWFLWKLLTSSIIGSSFIFLHNFVKDSSSIKLLKLLIRAKIFNLRNHNPRVHQISFQPLLLTL